MRILWATSHVPDPTRGGGWAFEFELLRSICDDHEVHVICAVSDDAPVGDAVRALSVDLTTVRWTPPHPPKNKPVLLWRAARGRMGGALAHAPSCAAALSDAVAHAEASKTFDVVAVYPGEMAEVAAATSAPSALFLTDIHTRQREQELAHADTWRQRLLWFVELTTMRRWERKWYPKAGALCTVTSIDADGLRKLTGCNADVVPVMIGNEWFVPPAIDRTPDVVSFIGALDYRPNIDAVKWFLDSIWPKIRTGAPNARMRVVGRLPVDEVRAAVAAAGAELVADVPDIRPYYWESAVVVAPIRLGSGMRTKILHAVATATPLVATSTAIEGIDLSPETHVAVADDANEFAQAVIDDLSDSTAARDRARRAAQAVGGYRTAVLASRVERFLARAARSGATER